MIVIAYGLFFLAMAEIIVTIVAYFRGYPTQINDLAYPAIFLLASIAASLLSR